MIPVRIICGVFSITDVPLPQVIGNEIDVKLVKTNSVENKHRFLGEKGKVVQKRLTLYS